MSLFLPSNLSPNFEEVFVNTSEDANIITFSFQVNTNGSQVRSYKIEILNELNDEEDPDDNILYTQYGIFGYPLYNKDFGHIYLDLNEVDSDDGMKLSDVIVPGRDYRWRVRLYEDEIEEDDGEGHQIININSKYGTTYIGSGNIVGTTKQVIWLDEYNDQIVEEDYVRTILYSNDTSNDYNPFNTKKTENPNQVCRAYPVFSDDKQYINEFKIKTDNILPDYYDKLLDGNTYMSVQNRQITQEQYNYIEWRYNDINNTLFIYGNGEMSNYNSRTNRPPWYQYREAIKTIVISSNLTTIGNYAFADLKLLKNITIPNDVVSINASAFSGCSALESVTIGDNVTRIGNSAFYNCRNLSTISIPAKVRNIGGYAFQGCTALNDITIPDTIISIGDKAFDNTKYYNDQFANDKTKQVLYIGNHLIKAKNITNATSEPISGEYSVVDGTKTIATNAFQNCIELTSINIPDTIVTIGNASFYGCTNLNNVQMGNGVKTIDTSAFKGCTALTEISVPDSVEVINDSAFEGCTNLTSITLGDGIKIIGADVFHNTGYYDDPDKWNDGVLYIGDYCIKCNRTDDDDDFLDLSDNTKSIAALAFAGCNITIASIPDTVISINSKAFYGCHALESVHIGSGVRYIGSQVFHECSKLVYIEISDLTSWCQIVYANGSDNPLYVDRVEDTTSRILYQGLVPLTEQMIIPESVTDIADFAFYGYTQLISVTINNNIRTIGKGAFSGCTGLQEVIFTSPDSFNTLNIKEDAFKDVSMSCFDRSLYSRGAVIFNNKVITTKNPDREQYTPKLIESLQRVNAYGHSQEVKVIIPSKQAYRKDFVKNNCYTDESGKMYCNLELVYIDRQQVYSVDKSVGKMQLSKLTLDKPLEYNTFHNTTIDIKLKNDSFARNRLYINSVREFDSQSYSNAYINLAYFEEELINTENMYIILTNQPDNWDITYNQYYEKKSNEEYVLSIAQYIEIADKPNNWDTAYNTYYIQNDTTSEDGFGRYILNTSNVWSDTITYYQMMPPRWEAGKYYKRMSNIDLLNYKQSAGIQQIINYVSDTGECKLFADLDFMPDQFYMYQIFVVDKNAPNYNAANTENPYKFFAGVGYDGTQITGIYDDELQIFGDNKDQTHACYLGGGYGIVTSFDNRFESSYKSTVFSNHQLDSSNPNQYLCFIQPNLGIKPDEYKPCMLQIYDKQIQKNVYITNYNDYNGIQTEFNKNYTIDTLDDSQWLVTLTYGNDDNINMDTLEQINQLIQTPQTKYKVYTNYVDSVPEGYFYCRHNKTLEFEYYDYYTDTPLNIDVYENDCKYVYNISQDVSIMCNIWDKTDSSDGALKNYVSLKSYKYTISLLRGTTNTEGVIIKNESNITLIKSTEKQYDGKLQIDLRGVNTLYGLSSSDSQANHSNLYRIQIEVEDELGHVYYLVEDVYFYGNHINGGIYNNCISATPNYTTQTLAINIDLPEVISKDTSLIVYKMVIYKQQIDQPCLEYLTQMDDSDLCIIKDNLVQYNRSSSIIDYSVLSNHAYKYVAYVEAQKNNDENDIYRYWLSCNEYTRPIWKTWSICDLDVYAVGSNIWQNVFNRNYELIPSTKIFTIKNNVEIGDISDNLNVITYQTLGKFGRIIQNKQKFDSGQIKCMVSDMCEYQLLDSCKNITKVDLLGEKINNLEEYINMNDAQFNKENYLYIITDNQTIYYGYNGLRWIPVNTQYILCSHKSLLDEWKNCIANEKIKLLKSPDGNMWIVSISKSNAYTTDWKSSQYPTSIIFSWQEIMDSDQIIVTKG